MRRVTASSSGGTTGCSCRSASVSSASTRLAATRSETLAAATPARRSPDFSSLAFASTSLTSRNRYVVPRNVAPRFMGAPTVARTTRGGSRPRAVRERHATHHALELGADLLEARGLGEDPWPDLPGRVVPDVLLVAALELGDPVAVAVWMEPGDAAGHGHGASATVARSVVQEAQDRVLRELLAEAPEDQVELVLGVRDDEHGV